MQIGARKRGCRVRWMVKSREEGRGECGGGRKVASRGDATSLRAISEQGLHRGKSPGVSPSVGPRTFSAVKILPRARCMASPHGWGRLITSDLPLVTDIVEKLASALVGGSQHTKDWVCASRQLLHRGPERNQGFFNKTAISGPSTGALGMVAGTLMSDLGGSLRTVPRVSFVLCSR